MAELLEDVDGCLTLANSLDRLLKEHLTERLLDVLFIVCVLGVDVRVEVPDGFDDLPYLCVELMSLD